MTVQELDFSPVILSRLGHKVTAIDYSDEMTAQAAKRFKEAGAEVLVRQMDAQKTGICRREL